MMATYKAITKTNHFHVTDAEKLKDIVSRMHCNSKVTLVEDEQGQNIYTIWAYSDIQGVYPDENSPSDIAGPDFGLLTAELQTILPEGEALILFELGTESLRYLTATATIVTRNEVKQIDLVNGAFNMARKILGNPMWETQIDN